MGPQWESLMLIKEAELLEYCKQQAVEMYK